MSICWSVVFVDGPEMRLLAAASSAPASPITGLTVSVAIRSTR
jgi:hypothetical protein